MNTTTPLPGSLAEAKHRIAPPHQTLPHSLDAEKGVLGSVFLHPACLDELSDLSAAHFYHPSHAVIWETCKAMYAERNPVDLVTITQRLADRNLLDKIGGPFLVAELQTFLPTAGEVKYYAAIVREKAQRRAIISVANETARMAQEAHAGESDSLLNEVEAKWLALREGTKADTSIHKLEKYVMEAVDGIESAYKNRGKIMGVATGITDFDRMTGGLKPGQLVIVAGRPGMGKSALSMQIAVHAAGTGDPVAVFSLEMTGRDLAERMICSDMPLDLNAVRNGFMAKNDFQKMMPSAMGIAALPIYIDETAALNIFELRGRARRAVTKYGAKLIVVDYLQLMRSTSKRAQENRANEVAEISMALKATAKELGVPVIAAAQLGRTAEERSTPKLADLRESGQIEQDADIVVMVHRPKKGLVDKETGESLEDGSVKLIVAKHRNGPVGDIDLTFESTYTRFVNKTESLYSNNEEKRQKYHKK